MADRIGRGRCPLCKSAKAFVSVSKRQLALITCNSCHSQTFARSDASDGIIRAEFLINTPDAANEPITAPVSPAATEPAPTILQGPAPVVADPVADLREPKPRSRSRSAPITRDPWNVFS